MNIDIDLWIHAVSYVDSAMCELCVILHIPDIFSSGSLAHLQSPAHLSVLQHRLAEALGHRYNHFYNSADIEEKVNLCRDALVFLNEHSDHLSPVPAMASLGAALLSHYFSSDHIKDLHEGFDMLSSAVRKCPSDPHYLVELENLMMHLYLVSGSLYDLDKSIEFLHHAHSLRIGHPARGKICRAIAAAMIFRDNHIGHRMVFFMETLIEHYKEVFLWQPLGHHSHFEGWDGLGMVLGIQFRRTNNTRIAC
jgi:hypothetical protein